MENETNIEIPISSEKDRFAQHLKAVNNQRIIFSGKFGSGKTYFLDKFFEEHEKYEPFFLSPVHYSVSRNEDVFEYIKYDVLINLLMKENINWDESKIDIKLIAQFFVINNFWSISKELISFLSKTGKLIGNMDGLSVADTVISRLSKLKSKYEEYKQEINANEKNTSIKFLEELSKQKGSFFEYNDITVIINNTLDSIIEKEKVLIIDDLDRMDPEHIFRILNVFSAQFNHTRFGYNKFDFDKVIIVCDLDNIRNLFTHKYGQGLDFSGYIDKFYSIEPFKFDNRKALINDITTFIKTNLDKSSTIVELVDPLFSHLVKEDIINLRKFVAKQKIRWKSPFLSEYWQLRDYPEYPILLVDFLLFMHGNIHEDICMSLNKIEKKFELNKIEWIRHLCPLFDFEFISIQQNKFPIELVAKFEDLDLKIKYNIEKDYSNRKEYFSNIIQISSYRNENEIVTKIPLFKLLSIAIQRYWILKKEIG